ncbi:MAG: hypothetical protein ACPMAQ_10000, partial [Phycisphaerae bacterium]
MVTRLWRSGAWQWLMAAVLAASPGAQAIQGAVSAVGDNACGQLGTGDPPWFPRQTLIAGQVTAVARGGAHSLAIQSDRTVWAWGNNMYGQLGDG